MSKKEPMGIQELFNLTHRVKSGSRLKIEFFGTLDGGRGPGALAEFLSECAPEGTKAVIENSRRPALEAALKTGRIQGSRTFFVTINEEFDRYGALHGILADGLVARMWKA